MSSSWESASKWYNSIVGNEGHYFHKNIILPKVLEIIKMKKISSILDLGCGQGILSNILSPSIEYCGIDLSSSLIKMAKKRKNHSFIVADIEKPLPIDKKNFDAAFIILSIQNLKNPQNAIKNAFMHLKKDGFLIIVMNHPCFRIPRQSSWDIDRKNNIQARKINKYMSHLEIPIDVHPSKKNSQKVNSYHHPLSSYSEWLNENNFSISRIYEWVSDKTSTGKYSKMENISRKEFPMFLTIVAKK